MAWIDVEVIRNRVRRSAPPQPRLPTTYPDIGRTSDRFTEGPVWIAADECLHADFDAPGAVGAGDGDPS